MSKQLEEIVKSISQMTHEELISRVRTIRRNKYEVRPAKAAIKKKEVGSELKKLLAGMSKEDQKDLFESLQGDKKDAPDAEA